MEELCEKVVEVRRVSDRMMEDVVAFEENVLRLICGRCLEEKQSFHDELKGEWDWHSTDDLLMCFGDINGHTGRHIDGFNVIHGGYGVGTWKKLLLEFCLEEELCVSNAWPKMEENKKVTFIMGEN